MTDKRDLKIEALREQFRNRIAIITDDYENRIADLRVELTEVEQKNQELVTILTESTPNETEEPSSTEE